MHQSLDKPRYINVKGRLIDLAVPKVMGILNITPDSFYSGSRLSSDSEIVEAAGKMLADGADILDVGGYSSRPGAADIPQETEEKRVLNAIKLIIHEYPGAVVSADTFRSAVAFKAVTEAGAAIINDISAGNGDPGMFRVVKDLNVPYVMMHMQGTPRTMQVNPVYDDIVADILKFFASRILELRSAGVRDIIIDPGFGFGKTPEHNFEILRRLGEFSIAGLPILAGLSRKSMIWKTLGTDPGNALNGTTALNTAALLKGADILRVHDVLEASEVVKLISKMKNIPDAAAYNHT